jgi:hypothetical protein
MQITAKLVHLLPLQKGTGKNGEWKKQDVVVETDGQFPKKICISIWGDKIDENKLRIGNLLTIDFDVESREYNGKWYTDVKAWKLDVAGAGGSSEGASSGSDAISTPIQNTPSSTDDLPF